MTQLELDHQDAALIFKANGDIIKALPDQDSTGLLPMSAYNVLLCSVFLANARLKKEVDKMIKDKVRRNEKNKK